MGLWPANRPPPLTEHLGRVEQLQQTAPALGLVGGKPPIGVSHAQQLEPEATHPEPRVDPQAVAPSFAAALRATGRGGRREQVSTMDHGPRCLVGLQLPSATCAEETGGDAPPGSAVGPAAARPALRQPVETTGRPKGTEWPGGQGQGEHGAAATTLTPTPPRGQSGTPTPHPAGAPTGVPWSSGSCPSAGPSTVARAAQGSSRQSQAQGPLRAWRPQGLATTAPCPADSPQPQRRRAAASRYVWTRKDTSPARAGWTSGPRRCSRRRSSRSPAC